MMRVVFAILLVLEFFGALAYALPKGLKGKKGQPQPSGSSATSKTTKTKDKTSTPVFLPSHWVKTPYKNCNAEKTEMINNWIMDAYNMTYEADRITSDNPAFERYFFREDFPKFKIMIQSFNSRAGLPGDEGKYNLACAEYKTGSPCQTEGEWAITPTNVNIIYFCPTMLYSVFSKVPYSSKPFDKSPNGWCHPEYLRSSHHPSHVYVHEMTHLMLHGLRLGFPVRDYTDGTNPRKAASKLKSNFTYLLAQWEQSQPRQGRPPLNPIRNAESYASTIIDFYFAQKCGSDFLW
ncbi:hypothetical protein F5890DRAFT_658677 [Lentinula detonsa]|uniref:Lysine-specific metallo-endopeptidase domain-containing protein n=1 Tax=Lentinula detonsa TaxID=2804962 RepID=A0AA38Q6L1_9AGAR|nr:hypothetical protein F5890DRAFT_658677 [Lentinula detonsa]